MLAETNTLSSPGPHAQLSTPQGANPVKLAQLETRRCSICNVADAPIRHVTLDSTWIDDHSVTVELRWLKKAEISPADKSRGWTLLSGGFQGKPALQRFICRPCLNSQSIVRKDFEKKAASELRKVNEQGYYSVLCGE